MSIFWAPRTATDCELCHLPWHWFARWKADRPLFLTSWRIRFNPVESTSGLTEVVFCACQTMQSFSFLVHLLRVLRVFDFSLVINETPNKWRQVSVKKKKLGDAVMETNVFNLSALILRPLWDSNRRCADQFYSFESRTVLSKMHYIYTTLRDLPLPPM